MRVYFGNYNQWGFLSTNLEYGTFFKASHIEQGVLTAGVNYFTGLFEIGKWKFRQFVKPQITIGINRYSSDSLTLNDSYGLEGFNSPALSGTNRFLLTLQTQSYAPWNIFGFRLGPYLSYSLGMLSDAITGFGDSKVYSQIGLGVLIKNENLVFNTFQISVSFYPLIPGKGQNIFKMNSFRTTDFGFRDFEIEKPGGMIYQ
jgi:hemolysin activation/secretion protein